MWRASWDRLGLTGGNASRSTLDARGYVGVFRQNVLAIRALRENPWPLPPELDRELVKLRESCFTSEDFREGIRAFGEKRRPQWKAR